MKIQVKYIILIAFLTILAILFIGYRIGRHTGESAYNANLHALNGEITRLTVELGDKTLYVAKVEQELLTAKEAKKAGDITNKELRALNLKQVNEISRLNLKIDTLLSGVSHTGDIIITKPDSVGNIPQYAIKLPFSFTKKDQWLNLTGMFNSVGKLDLSLKLDFNGDLYVGIDKTTKKNTALFTTNCPYINTIKFESIKFDLPSVKKYGIGLQIGYGMSKTGLAPYVGIGLSYNLIRW
jgi:hypothetical protein